MALAALLAAAPIGAGHAEMVPSSESGTPHFSLNNCSCSLQQKTIGTIPTGLVITVTAVMGRSAPGACIQDGNQCEQTQMCWFDQAKVNIENLTPAAFCYDFWTGEFQGAVRSGGSIGGGSESEYTMGQSTDNPVNDPEQMSECGTFYTLVQSKNNVEPGWQTGLECTQCVPGF